MERDIVCCSLRFQGGCQIWPASCLVFDRPGVHHFLLHGLFSCSVCNSSLNCIFKLHPFSHIFYLIFSLLFVLAAPFPKPCTYQKAYVLVCVSLSFFFSPDWSNSLFFPSLVLDFFFMKVDIGMETLQLPSILLGIQHSYKQWVYMLWLFRLFHLDLLMRVDGAIYLSDFHFFQES